MELSNIGHSRWNDLRYFLVSLLFVCLGIVLLVRDGRQLAAWLAIVFFGAGCLLLLYQLVTGRELQKTPKCEDKITFDDAGFAATLSKGPRTRSCSMTWSEVSSVCVFKRDLFIVDCVCMLLARENGTGIEVDEEMDGWQEFTRGLPTYLPGCIAWEKVVFASGVSSLCRQLD